MPTTVFIPSGEHGILPPARSEETTNSPFHLKEWRQNKPAKTEALNEMQCPTREHENAQLSIKLRSHTQSQGDLKANGAVEKDNPYGQSLRPHRR